MQCSVCHTCSSRFNRVWVLSETNAKHAQTARLQPCALCVCVCVWVCDVCDADEVICALHVCRRFAGLELQTHSNLPVGSGLGGSSILGAAVLKAIGLAVGQDYDNDALVHEVLILEQVCAVPLRRTRCTAGTCLMCGRICCRAASLRMSHCSAGGVAGCTRPVGAHRAPCTKRRAFWTHFPPRP